MNKTFIQTKYNLLNLGRKSAYATSCLLFIIINSLAIFTINLDDLHNFNETFSVLTSLISLSLSSLLLSNYILNEDIEDGTITQLYIYLTKSELVLSKLITHFIISAIPIALISPLIFKYIFLVENKNIMIIFFVMLVTGFIQSAVVIFTEFLTIKANRTHASTAIIALPFYISVLIIASSAIVTGELSLLMGLFFVVTPIMVLASILNI